MEFLELERLVYSVAYFLKFVFLDLNYLLVTCLEFLLCPMCKLPSKSLTLHNLSQL